jgi:hypothetical protein
MQSYDQSDLVGLCGRKAYMCILNRVIHEATRSESGTREKYSSAMCLPKCIHWPGYFAVGRTAHTHNTIETEKNPRFCLEAEDEGSADVD